MAVYTRYPEDPTGQNRDNLISGELFQLTDRPIRVLVPKYGPFFVNESLVIYDGVTEHPLVRGQDYRVPLVSQELSLRYGIEVGDAILIENPGVSSGGRITYQCVGGDYQNNVDNIVQIYEAVVNDHRGVDWLTGVYGKPSEFKPSPHPHWLSEIYGFEPLTHQLERLVQAVLLGHAPAYEQLLKAYESAAATKEEMELGKPSKRLVNLEGLIHVLDKYNFNQMKLIPETLNLRNGASVWFDVEATHDRESMTYYWKIEHIGTQPEDFQANTGIVHLVKGRGRFIVQSARDKGYEDEEGFRVTLHVRSPEGVQVLRSPKMTLKRHGAGYRAKIRDAMTTCCEASPLMKRTARTLSINRSLNNVTYG